MPQQLDVYRDWLGVKATDRPLNHYQLLRLKSFDDDAAGIRKNYRKLNAHVRKFATGEFGEQSQDLLNELAKAMLCLTDTKRKREYDASLGRKDSAQGEAKGFEEILLAGGVIDQSQLDGARRFAEAVNLDIHVAVLQKKLAAADVVMLAYAESEGLPYIELDDVGVAEHLVPRVPPTLARQNSCVPVMDDGGVVLMASPAALLPDVEEELRLRMEMPVRTVLCTPEGINAAIAKYFPHDAPQMAPVSSKQGKAKRPAKAARPPADPETLAEWTRQRTLFSIMAFCFGVTAYALLKSLVLGGVGGYGDFGAVLLKAASIGLVTAGVTFGVMTSRKP